MTQYSMMNLSKMPSQHDGDERVSSDEVGGSGQDNLGNSEVFLPNNIIVPSQVDLLYQDALQRQLRKQRIQENYLHEECTFQPNVNRSVMTTGDG